MPFLSDFQGFKHNITIYDPENALALAKAAQLAYAYNQEDTIEKTVKSWGFTGRFELWNVNGTQAYIAANDEAILAVFAGTNERSDWCTNLGFLPMPGPIGSVHRGFMGALDLVWAEMQQIIFECKMKRMRDRLKPPSLWFAGHSLGAALATLAVARLRMEDDQPVHGLYTYGSPRVGDRTFARNFNLEFKPAFRIVNNTDIVTRVPSRVMLYSHIGNFLYLDIEKKLHTDVHWWYSFLDTVEGAADDFKNRELGTIADHMMDQYIGGLERNRAFNPYHMAQAG